MEVPSWVMPVKSGAAFPTKSSAAPGAGAAGGAAGGEDAAEVEGVMTETAVGAGSEMGAAGGVDVAQETNSVLSVATMACFMARDDYTIPNSFNRR
jgi:hypothetical protein